MSTITYERPQSAVAPAKHVESRREKNYVGAFNVYRRNDLHDVYDFSLEFNGIRKTWSVSRGPSMSTRDKRLAIMMEHPVDYKESDELWDHGTYQLAGGNPSFHEMFSYLEKGSLRLELTGKNLNGSFSLVKIKGTEDCWLMTKQEDKYSVPGAYRSEYYRSGR